MANAYVSLDVFKGSGVLNIVGSDEDARLLSLLEHASRVVDRHCNRHFHELDGGAEVRRPGRSDAAGAGPDRRRPRGAADGRGRRPGVRDDVAGVGLSAAAVERGPDDGVEPAVPAIRPHRGFCVRGGQDIVAVRTAAGVDFRSLGLVAAPAAGEGDGQRHRREHVGGRRLIPNRRRGGPHGADRLRAALRAELRREHADGRPRGQRDGRGGARSGVGHRRVRVPGAGRGGDDHPGGASAARPGPRKRRSVRHGPDGTAEPVPQAGARDGR